ncbi:MAG: lipopolysaccharide biosynthesis protein [Ignavibacteria bacterium]
MLKKLVKESLIYGLSGYISKFIGVFLLPLYTFALKPADYGILDLLNSVAVFSSFIIISGTDAAVGFYYFRNEFKEERSQLVSSGLIIRIVFGLTVALLLVLLSPPLTDLLFKNEETQYVRLYALYIAFNSVFFFTTELLRFQMKPWIYTIFSSGNVLVNILSAILFVLILGYGVTGAILASIISYGIFAIAGVVYIFRNFELRFSFKWAKNILSYGFPLIGTALASWVLVYSDRYFLNYFSGLEQIGIYSVGLKVAAIMGMIAGAFQMSWGPFAADIQYEPNARRIYAKVFQLYFIGNILIIFVVSLFSDEILRLLTQPAYYSANSVIPLLCFSSLFIGAYFIANAGIGLTKKLYHTIWITITAAGVNILINALLTPKLLATGSAIAILAANFTIFLLTLLTSQKFYKIEYRYSVIIYLIVSTAIIIVLKSIFVFSLILKIILAAIYLLTIGYYMYKTFRHSEEFVKLVEVVKKFTRKTEEKPRSSEP